MMVKTLKTDKRRTCSKLRSKSISTGELQHAQSEISLLKSELGSTQQKVEELQRKYSLLFDSAPAGYVTISADHTIKEINQRGKQILSDGTKDLTGRTLDDFFSVRSQNALRSFYKAITSGTEKKFCELVSNTGAKEPVILFTEGSLCKTTGDILINLIDVSGLEQSALLFQQTRQNYETFFNAIEEFLYVMDHDGKITYTNTALREKLGFNEADLLDLTFDKLHPAELRKEAIKGFRSMLDGKEKICRLPLLGRTGEEIPVETRLSPGQWNGQPAVFAISKDMTEQKLAEQILRVSERKYRTMLNASPDGVLLVGLDGIISEISELALQLFGAETRVNIIGKHIYDFVPEDEHIILEEIIDRTLAEGLSQNTEIMIRRHDKATFSGELSSTLIQGPDGAPLSYLLIARDITQRKKDEAKQIHADRMANLGEMASGIAHEINQPLNIISMVLDAVMLESARKDVMEIDFIKQKFDRIFENITRIRNIIDHIRAFSRSHDDYVLSPFNLNAAIENSVSMITEQFKYLGINLRLDLDSAIIDIYGNTYKFEQVMLNLLVNAKDAVIEKKHALKDYSDMEILIKSYKSYTLIIVEVSDNGIGIREEDINNVILPFYTTKDESKGTGLGLSICYQIIKEMNGTIDIVSSRHIGTKIRITIDPGSKTGKGRRRDIE